MGHGTRALDGDHATQLRLNFVGGGADQQHHARVLPQGFAKDGVVAPFILAAQNHQQVSRKSVQRLDRGVNVGSLGIIEIFHAGNFGHKLDAMLDAREGTHTFRNRRRLDSHQSCRCRGSKNIFNVMIAA